MQTPEFVGILRYLRDSTFLVTPRTLADTDALTTEFPPGVHPGRYALVAGTPHPSLWASDGGTGWKSEDNVPAIIRGAGTTRPESSVPSCAMRPTKVPASSSRIEETCENLLC